jgi:hypothetical protein
MHRGYILSFLYFCFVQIPWKFNQKDAIAKLDSQMVSLQQNAISFSGKSIDDKKSKKIEPFRPKSDVPSEDIDAMIVSFKDAATDHQQEEAKSVKTKTKK